MSLRSIPSALLLAAALAAMLIASVSAAEPAARWDMQQLMQRMAQTSAARARFSETKHSSLVKTPLVSSGTLSYTRPDRIAKQTLSPYEESISVEGDTLTLENKAKGVRHTLALQSYPVVWAFVESIRATLSGNLKTLQRFYELRFDGTPQAWLLSLEPTDVQMAAYVQTIRIRGTEGRITSIEIFEAGGDRSLMTITAEAP
jgi:outer membrane lipoprotein-sorting protein